MAAAESVATALGHPPVYPVSSVRDLEDCLAVTDLSGQDLDEAAWAEALRRVVAEESAALDASIGTGGGRLAVIAPDPTAVAALLAEEEVLAAAMQAPGGDVLRARLAVMSPVTSKGLEFDTVVLVEAQAVGERSPGDLYVAMTRPTRRLHLVSRHALPAGLPR